MTGSTAKLFLIDDEPSERFPVWTRGNVGEVFAEAVSPLTWDLLGFRGYELGWRDALAKIGAFALEEFRADDNEVCGAFGGYVYINVSASRVLAVRLPGMTPEQMDQSFFGDQEAPAYVPSPADENAERTAQAGAWLMSLLTGPDLAFLDEDKAYIDGEAAARGDLQSLTDAELLGRARRFTGEMRRFFGSHIYLLYGANVVTSVVSGVCTAVGRSELASEILAGLGEVDSTGTSDGLWALSRQVRASATLTTAFDGGTDGLLERLAKNPDAADFLVVWDEFIQQHGAYGKNMWELRSATFATHPSLAVEMLDLLRRADDSQGPTAKTAELAERREKAIGEVAALLAGDEETLSQFLGAAANVKLLLPGRERAKTNCVKCIQEARLALRELGRRVAAAGTGAADDIMLVLDAELEDYLADPASASAAIAARRHQLDELCALEPPFVFAGDAPRKGAFRPRHASRSAGADAGSVITGLGAAPGTHTGRARTIQSIDEAAKVEDGDVLVAEITDSTWGPLFLTAGAVIVEAGSPISHAVIVSRELGIPAVVSVPDAVDRIPDGARVTVDGGAGTITIEEV